MTTSWTEADVAVLETAIKSGVRSVVFSGRQVQYHSLDEMLRLLQAMKDEIAEEEATTSASRTTYASFRKGPNG